MQGDQRLDGRGAIDVEQAERLQVVSKRAILGTGPGLERRDEVDHKESEEQEMVERSPPPDRPHEARIEALRHQRPIDEREDHEGRGGDAADEIER